MEPAQPTLAGVTDADDNDNDDGDEYFYSGGVQAPVSAAPSQLVATPQQEPTEQKQADFNQALDLSQYPEFVEDLDEADKMADTLGINWDDIIVIDEAMSEVVPMDTANGDEEQLPDASASVLPSSSADLAPASSLASSHFSLPGLTLQQPEQQQSLPSLASDVDARNGIPLELSQYEDLFEDSDDDLPEQQPLPSMDDGTGIANDNNDNDSGLPSTEGVVQETGESTVNWGANDTPAFILVEEPQQEQRQQQQQFNFGAPSDNSSSAMFNFAASDSQPLVWGSLFGIPVLVTGTESTVPQAPPAPSPAADSYPESMDFEFDNVASSAAAAPAASPSSFVLSPASVDDALARPETPAATPPARDESALAVSEASAPSPAPLESLVPAGNLASAVTEALAASHALAPSGSPSSSPSTSSSSSRASSPSPDKPEPFDNDDGSDNDNEPEEETESTNAGSPVPSPPAAVEPAEPVVADAAELAAPEVQAAPHIEAASDAPSPVSQDAGEVELEATVLLQEERTVATPTPASPESQPASATSTT